MPQIQPYHDKIGQFFEVNVRFKPEDILTPYSDPIWGTGYRFIMVERKLRIEVFISNIRNELSFKLHKEDGTIDDHSGSFPFELATLDEDLAFGLIVYLNSIK